jgi:hypothetical protein
MQVSNSVNSVPGLRNYMPVLMPLFSFFDDYWYYIYHEDTYKQLLITPGFIGTMYLMNQQRTNLSYLNFPVFINLNTKITSNYSQYTNIQVSQVDQQQTYLIQNIQGLIFQQYVLLAVLMGTVKLVSVLLGMCLSYNKSNEISP